MGYPGPLEFHEHFSVTRCRNPDYCHYCDKLITLGQIKVVWKTRQYHKGCIEAYGGGAVHVNTETMKVEAVDESDRNT